jgi:hypothetical protein
MITGQCHHNGHPCHHHGSSKGLYQLLSGSSTGCHQRLTGLFTGFKSHQKSCHLVVKSHQMRKNSQKAVTCCHLSSVHLAQNFYVGELPVLLLISFMMVYKDKLIYRFLCVLCIVCTVTYFFLYLKYYIGCMVIKISTETSYIADFIIKIYGKHDRYVTRSMYLLVMS